MYDVIAYICISKCDVVVVSIGISACDVVVSMCTSMYDVVVYMYIWIWIWMFTVQKSTLALRTG
jgi:hypothetical protein